ncbi:AraC family transcriptional regulator [Zhongshania sp.]|uniref:AraC family transcriptional regulator n=1 Tax=Zhongshania sp. TaxID=1971902 RepID=UPI00356ADCF7
MENRTISIAFIRNMVSGCGLAPRYCDELLRRAGVDPAAIDSPQARVSPTQLSQLNKWITDATGDEGMGHYLRPQKRGTFNILARYMQTANDLQQAIERNVGFYNLFDFGFRLTLLHRGENIHYRVEAEYGVVLSNWVYEQLLMVNHRFLCWLTNSPIPLSRVNLNYATPAHSGEYHYLFFSDTRFNQPHCEIIFDKKLLKLPVLRSSQELEDYLSKVPYEFLHSNTRASSYTEQIRTVIKKSLPSVPSYDVLADTLGITPQTLRRRLRQEGCDYRLIKNELIRDTAIGYLLHDNKDVKSISYLLGFSEPSAFIRSFKKWTGATPKQYREKYGAAPRQESTTSKTSLIAN